MLGEDDDLALAATVFAHGGRLQQAGKLVPFAVLARVDESPGLFFQVGQDDDFSLKLLDGSRGGSLVDHGFFKILVVVWGQCIV